MALRSYLSFLFLLLFFPPVPALETNQWLREAGSDYLQQHADNAIHWYPWTKTSFTRARELNRPVFVFIGQPRCHWCALMNREVFNHPETGRFMNSHFVNILIDGEQQKHISRKFENLYSAVVGIAAYPMSVWLTAQGLPFLGKYYLDSDQDSQHETLLTLAKSIIVKWQGQRADIEAKALAIKSHVVKQGGGLAFYTWFTPEPM